MENLIRLIQRATIIGDFGDRPANHVDRESITDASETKNDQPDLLLSCVHVDSQPESPRLEYSQEPTLLEPPPSGYPSRNLPFLQVPPPPYQAEYLIPQKSSKEPSRSPPPPYTMGQKSSSIAWVPARSKMSLAWALDQHGHVPSLIASNKQLISRSLESEQQQTMDKSRCRSISPVSGVSSARLPGNRRRRQRKPHKSNQVNPSNHKRFGYEIQDVDEFLSRASLDCPANIPMVLSTSCLLYQTHMQHPQKEVSLPLGMVVNSVLKNLAWLYVQTPHGEEGYVPYACCIPLGILPPPSRPQPCWDTQTDIFPRPMGNRTDTQKMREGTRSECNYSTASNSTHPTRHRLRSSGERSVDGLYLQAARNTTVTSRQTLLVIASDYHSPGRNALSVKKGDVVSLVSSHLREWFWVRDRDGQEGFIPAVVAGHGFL